MIYQLLRRDPAWKLMPYAAVAGGVCMLARSGVAGTTLFVPLLYACLLFAEFRRRATLFQTALPIPARTLFAARCVAFAALVWLPVLTAMGVAVLKGEMTIGPLDCGAAASLLTISALSVRLKEMEGSLSVMLPVLGLGVGFGVAAFLILPPAPVLAFCAVASVALFVRAWHAMPESFQVAPAEAQKPSSRRPEKSAPAIPWLPLLRAAVPIRGLGFVPPIWQILLTHTASWPGACCFGIFASGLLQPNTRWLQSLPVARRTLLGMVAATASLMVAIPYGVSVKFGWGGHTSFRLGLINVACIILVCIGELILVMAWGSYRIRRLPMWFRQSVFIPVGIVVLLGSPIIALLSSGNSSRIGLLEALVAYFSNWLPRNPAAVFVLGAIAIAAMFRLLEKLEAQAEWPELFNQRAPGELTSLKLN